MAPIPADGSRGGAVQRQARRIVPAIPRRFARALPSARPITPSEESSKDAAPQVEIDPKTEPRPEPQAQALTPQQHFDEPAEAPPQEQRAGTVETPLTPDSRASDADNCHGAAPAVAQSSPPPTSPAKVNGHVDDNTTATPGGLSHRGSGVALNGVHRNLTIPAQLPPPFYPADQIDSLAPLANGHNVAHQHRHQLSAGAIVFHSAMDSPAAPATTQGMDVNAQEQQSPLPRVPPAFGSSHFAPFIPGHSHHPSDAGASRSHLPYPVVSQEPVYQDGGDLRSPHLPVGPNAYPSPYTDHFASQDVSFITNGVLTSQPQSPSKAHFGTTRPNSDQGEELHPQSHQNGTVSSSDRLEVSPFELATYLSTQFGNPEFADFLLQIRSPDSILISIPVHAIVVVRSPIIAEAVRRSPVPGHRSRDARRLIDLPILDSCVTRESLEEAVKVLYGAPLLSAQTFLYGLEPYPFENEHASPSGDAQRRMQQALSYIATARTLQMPSMQARGIEIARMLLRWDTLDQVLQYGLQTSSESRPRVEILDADDPFIAALLNYATEFMAYTFPVDFNLYTIASEFQDAPRLPTLLESRAPIHNPRLSKIRFGDAPLEGDLQPSHATRVLSTVLLSIPVSLIERLFNHRATANQIGWSGAVRIMRDVITERENRRKKALRSQLKPSRDGTVPAVLLNNMYIEERMEQQEPTPSHPSGHRLATIRTISNV